MQPKFTLKKRKDLRWLTPVFFIFFSLFSVVGFAQPATIYQTDGLGTQGAEITPTANGAACSLGDAIVMAGVNRYINSVTVNVFTLASTAPFDLTLRIYTDCSTDGVSAACGSGPGVLVPNSTITKTGIVPPAIGTIFTVVFNYTANVNLTAETDNQINIVLNASRSDVFWPLGEAPTIGAQPPGEPATAGGSVVTRCGSTAGNNGCARDFGIRNNFNIKIQASLTPCQPVNALAPTISSVPSSTCAGTPITLSILAGTLNGAAEWRWYSGTCGGTLVGIGNSVTVSPAATTTYFARGEGGCAPGPGPCASQVVTVTPCTCIAPDVSTICSGTAQKLSVKQSSPATTSTVTRVNAIAVPAAPGTGAATGAPANPYPDVIAVAGLPLGTTISSVTINGFTHTFPSDVDILLRSPSGQNVIIMSDAGGATAVTNQSLTFGDGFASTLTGAATTGNYKPTNIVGTLGNEPDNFPAPGPGTVAQPNPTLASISGNVNGNWELYVVDDFGGDFGSISGWSITFSVPAITATWTPVTGLFQNANGTGAYVAGTPAAVVYASPAATTTYTATVSAGPCAGANTVTVNVLPTPAITVTPNTTPGACSPATLTANGASIYNWTGPVGTLNTTTGPTVIATTPVDASYTVSGFGANGCATVPVTVAVQGSSIAAVISSLGGPPVVVWNEGLDGTIPPTGWSSTNNSSPIGAGAWTQGGALGVFPPESGAGFASVNFNSGSGTSTLSNWLFTPNITNLTNGDQLVFFARSINAGFPDRLQVRLSAAGTSTNVGATATSVGDFSNLLLDINPTYNTTAFPNTWVKYTATVSGLGGPTSGRFAFRYFVENGGPGGANSDFMGIDNVTYQKPPLATCANTTSTIKVDITGGTSPYTLVYSNGTSNTTFGGYISGTPIQVSPAVTTTYTIVSVTSANGCAGSGNTGTAVITVTPAPSITTQPPNRVVCDGQNTTFTVTAGPAIGTTYQWQISVAGGPFTNIANGGVYSGATSSTLTITGVTTALSGNSYRVVVTGACPPTSVTSTAGTLTVNVPPAITTQPANTAKCVGTTATFTVAASGNAPTYQWQVSTNFGLSWTNIAGATTATLTLAGVAQTMNNNQYRAVVTVAPCAATATSAAGILTVNPLPVVTISSPTLQLIPGRVATITGVSTPSAVSYSWTRNGLPTAGTTGTLIVGIDSIGTYRLTVTDNQNPGCVGSSNNLVIGTATSDRLFIYPNPTSGVIQARLYYGNTAHERREVHIYNSQGQIVAKKSYDLFFGMSPYLKMDFDLTGLASGTYLMKVTEKGTGRIVSAQFLKISN